MKRIVASVPTHKVKAKNLKKGDYVAVPVNEGDPDTEGLFTLAQVLAFTEAWSDQVRVSFETAEPYGWTELFENDQKLRVLK